jgi:hypothetical protein
MRTITFVNRGSSARPLTRRQILRGVVATASAASGEQYLTH